MELHDIFPPVEIVEYSLVILLASCLSICSLFYLVYKYLGTKKKSKSYYLTILQKYSKEDAKRTAYLFSFYGKNVITTQRQKSLLHQINTKLYDFKFKQTYQNIPHDIKRDIDYFLSIVDIKHV